MATKKQKQELIDTIKNPERHYRITLSGYGGEGGYLSLNKQQYEYWNQLLEDEGEENLINYLMEAESEELDFEVPEEVDFLRTEVNKEVYHRAWYDADNEVAHHWGVNYDSARITIDEVSAKEYSAKIIENLVDGQELAEWVHASDSEVDQYEMVECKEINVDPPQYIMQVYNAEKGTFFEGYFTTVGKFNPTKLRIISTEYWDGEQIVEDIIYDGISIDNEGGSTNGKGMSVGIWETFGSN